MFVVFVITRVPYKVGLFYDLAILAVKVHIFNLPLSILSICLLSSDKIIAIATIQIDRTSINILFRFQQLASKGGGRRGGGGKIVTVKNYRTLWVLAALDSLTNKPPRARIGTAFVCETGN